MVCLIIRRHWASRNGFIRLRFHEMISKKNLYGLLFWITTDPVQWRTIKPHSRTSMFLSNWGNLVMEVRLTSLHQFLFIYVASTVHNQIRELCTTMIWCTVVPFTELLSVVLIENPFSLQSRRNWRDRWAIPPPDFGRSVNPNSIRGSLCPHCKYVQWNYSGSTIKKLYFWKITVFYCWSFFTVFFTS